MNIPSWDEVQDWLEGKVDFAGEFTLGGGSTETTVTFGRDPGPSWQLVALGATSILVLILLAIIFSE